MSDKTKVEPQRKSEDEKLVQLQTNSVINKKLNTQLISDLQV